jgi:hypothetical protein
MRIRAKVCFVVSVLTIVMGYMGGVAFSQLVVCEKGCKQILAKTLQDDGKCIAYDVPHCYSHSMWVDQPERDDYGELKTSCVPVSPREEVARYSCKDCTEVCSNVGGSTLREMSAPDLYDCTILNRIDRKECM